MFDIFRNAFGLAYVEEKDGIITIGGINTTNLLIDIGKIWGNTRVVKLMFNNIERYRISFYSFFAVDCLYLMQQINNYKQRSSSYFRINNVIKELRENTWLRRIDVQYPSILNMRKLKELLYTLRPHQLEALESYDLKTQKMGLDGYLLAADPGAGKTLMGLALAVTLEVDVAILLAPKSILDNVWTDGIIEQFRGKYKHWSSTSNEPISNNCKFYVVHFDAISKLIPLIPMLKKKKTIVILDESHNFNDSKSKRSGMFVEFCHSIDCHHVIFSSGTPLKMLGFETITLLQCIDKLFTPEVEDIFRKIFGVSSKRAVDILRNRINLISHKIPQAVFMSIPPPITKKLRVKLPNKGGNKYTIANVKLEMQAFIKERMAYHSKNMNNYVDTYNECINIYRKSIRSSKDISEYNKYVEYIRMISHGYDNIAHKEALKYCKEFEKKKLNPVLNSAQKKAFKDAISVIRFVNLKVLGEALGQVLGKRRAECHCDMIPHLDLISRIEDANMKTMCFSSFVSVLDTAEQYLIKNGLKPTVVHGSIDRSVDIVVKEFKSDQNLNPMLATFQSMSAGITLTLCSEVIFLNMPWRDYIREQAVARAHRIGQLSQVTLTEVTLDTGGEPNISTRSEYIMEWSRQQVELIMGKDVSDKELEGIVDRLQLNPMSNIERAFRAFSDLFR